MSSYGDYALISAPDERSAVSSLESLFLIVSASDRSGRKCEVMAECAIQAGMKFGTFRRKFYAWKESGPIGAADKRRVRKERKVPDIMGVFKTYCEKYSGDTHIHAAAHRRMMTDFRIGKLFPNIGTWREVWKMQYGESRAMPAYCPAAWTPHGWGYGNLMDRLAEDPTHLAALAWNMRGQYAASPFVQDVMRSRWDAENRRQLPAGRVMQWDDAWENNLVMLPGAAGAYRPIGFHCYDIATGYHLYPFMKPRTYSKVEGTDRVKGDNLTEQMFRMAFAFVHVVIGISKHGVTHVLENGTTAIRENVRRRIETIPEFGRLIKFATSAPKNLPAHLGMFAGAVGGNPQFKSTVEGAHRYRQLEMAHLPSNVGNSAANKPEALETWKRHEEKFLAALDLKQIPPEILKIAEKRLPMWDEYYSLACATFDAINDCTRHRLEGWHDYYKQEFRDPDDPNVWHPMAVLDQLTPTSQERIEGLIATDSVHNVRSRRMSRREAWQSWVERGELVKVPLCEMQAFLDPRDAKELTVTPKRTIRFKDATYYGEGVEMVYEAKYVDRNNCPHLLAPGEKVRVYFNCWGSLQNHVWLANMEDEPLGMCDLVGRSFWGNPEQIREAAKQKLIDQAEMLHDTRARHFDAAAQKLADEWGQRLFAEAAKSVRAAPVTFKSASERSVDVLALTRDGRAQTQAAPLAGDESDAAEDADFLSRMNGYSMNV